jgi:hypothetical protein
VTLEPEEKKLGESGTGREETRRVKPEEKRPGDSGTGREKTRRVWNRKRKDQESLEPEESIQGKRRTARECAGVLPKIKKNKICNGRGI